MQKRVVRTYIDRWIDINGPDGLLKLAVKSGVSASTITKARLGYPPKKQHTRTRICEAIGVAEHRVFPSVASSKEEAS